MQILNGFWNINVHTFWTSKCIESVRERLFSAILGLVFTHYRSINYCTDGSVDKCLTKRSWVCGSVSDY